MVEQLTHMTAQVPLFLQILLTALWSAIPGIESDLGAFIAIVVGVPLVPAIIAAIIGNWIAVIGIIFLTDRIRTWIKSKAKTPVSEPSKRQTKVTHAMHKYGVPGASLLGPLLIGTHINAFFMAAAGADRRYLLIWQTIAIIIWGIVSGILAAVTVGLLTS